MDADLRILVPPLKVDSLSEPTGEERQELDQWMRGTCLPALELVHERLASGHTPSSNDTAGMIVAVLPLARNSWSTDDVRKLATNILGVLPPSDLAVVSSILADHIKPLFLSNPHPRINATSGRALPRAQGGPLGAHDFLEGQTWKSHVGVAEILSWCVRHCQSTDYERLWHLLIPPIMTFLDDHQGVYKLKGVELVHEMLNNIPPELLRRTGMDGLLHSSLAKSLSHLRDPCTPDLVRSAAPTAILLVDKTTQPHSAERFNRLSTLLGESIIGTVWTYAAQDAPAIVASLDILPQVVESLGIGTARYLKTIVHQLLHPLLALSSETGPLSDDKKQENLAMQQSSLHALITVMRVCRPCIHRWKGSITEGIARCWTASIDNEACQPTGKTSDAQRGEIRRLLATVAVTLAEVCPAVLENEYARLLQLDSMFNGLLPRKETF